MGAKLCTPWSPFKECMKPKCFKRKIEMEKTSEKILALQDWILASPGLKPDYLMTGGDAIASKPSKKKVHPCSTRRFRGSLISEAKDSLCLDRPMNLHEEKCEGMSTCSLITKNLSGKISQKRVSFKLPHTVIFYSPDHEPYCKEDSLCSPEEHKPYSSEDEPLFRLAVDILPHVFVSSKFES